MVFAQIDQERRLHDWRFLHLRELGLPVHDAEMLVVVQDVGHEAERLILAGCPPALAYPILRPD